MNSSESFVFIYVVVSTENEARNIARTIVKERLAACANILPGMNSIYWWNDELCEEKEVVLLLKSPQKNFRSIEHKIKEIHSYACPCIVALPLTESSPDYLKWLTDETNK